MKKPVRTFRWTCVTAVLILLSVSLLWKNPFLTALFLVILSAAMIAIGKIKEDFYLFVIVSLAGAIAEIIAIASGAWTYSFPNIFGIPIWLPFAWGNAGLFVKRLYLKINKLNYPNGNI